MKQRPLLVIGLDAADKDLIDRWVSEGALPVFERLSKSAIRGEIENPRGLEAGSCWPTFGFGLGPAETGQFDGAREFDSQSYLAKSYRPETSRRDPIWSTLSKAGKLCGVVDFPYSYPLDDVSGMKVIDRGSHVPAGGGNDIAFRTYPEELAGEIIERFGPDPADLHMSDYFPLETVEDVSRFRDIYLQRIENKTDLILHYWRQRPWDFFIGVYTEAHCLGHRCWHLHDPDYPDHDPAMAAAIGDPLKDSYIALDRAVGRLIDEVKDEARVVVYLSHGMGPRYSGSLLLDRILARLDNKGTITQSGPLMQVARGAWRRMPDFVRGALWGLRDRVTHDGFQPNRRGRRFFEVFSNDRTGGVRINLAGREAEGIVQPGAEYDQLCDQLIADFAEITNAETGEPLTTEIIKVHDLYAGAYLDKLPDILLTWNRSSQINAARSPKIGMIDKAGLINPRSGDHLPVGRFYAVAPEWPSKELTSPVKAEDFAPTIADLFSVDLAFTEGKPIAALLKTAHMLSTE